MYDRAMADGVLTEYEADRILVAAGTRVDVNRPLPR